VGSAPEHCVDVCRFEELYSLLPSRGKEQCAELQTNFAYHSGVDLIVSSPKTARSLERKPPSRDVHSTWTNS
jgi:hypothetical protein